MKQDTALTMLYGALTAALGYGIFLAVKKTSAATRELVAGLAGIGHIAETNQKLVESSLMVATELQMLRSSIVSNVAPQAGNDEEPPAPGPVRVPRHPFPPPNFDIYKTFVPDTAEAAPEDTEITDTSDAQLAEMEAIEEIRLQGFEADPEELHEGIVRQAE